MHAWMYMGLHCPVDVSGGCYSSPDSVPMTSIPTNSAHVTPLTSSIRAAHTAHLMSMSELCYCAPVDPILVQPRWPASSTVRACPAHYD